MPSPSNETTFKRRRRVDGERTHAAILQAAARLASVEGINGLTIGRLADVLGVSKSGLYAHFGSKERLQLETIEAAWAIFEEEVVAPSVRSPEGLEQLRAVIEAFFSYVERGVFPGGCFFAALLAEEDARTGPIHDVVVSLERRFAEEMAGLVREAHRRGEIASGVDAEQLAFELYACMELANFHFVLFRDPDVLGRGRSGVSRILAQAAAQV